MDKESGKVTKAIYETTIRVDGDDTMDEKECIIFDHYKRIIESQMFDEYDILGFLIFIRSHIINGYPIIREFSDFIAHRERDRGIIVKNSKRVKENGYKVNKSNKILSYKGITGNEWKAEWVKLGKNFGISLTDDILSEIMLCIFSLAQFATYTIHEDMSYCRKKRNCVAEYIISLSCFLKGRENIHDYVTESNNNVHGRLYLWMLKNGNLALITSERCVGAVPGVFSMYGKYCFVGNSTAGCIFKPVETKRINGELRLMEGDKRLI